MENPTQPNSDGAAPKLTNTEALSILANCLAQSFQANREWEKFARGLPDQAADQQAELAALIAAEAWLDALPQPVAFAPQDGRPAVSIREGLADMNKRLYEAAENLGGGCLADELESLARLASRLTSTELSEVSTLDLEGELLRRGCACVVITPDDVREQWRTNQDADDADEPAPTDKEIRNALCFVQRRLERTIHENEPSFEWGATSDACEWITVARRDDKKGGAK